jgi:tetratricopeptide (TPR) repeat protein
MGNLNAAIKDYSTAIQFDNTYADAFFNRAIIYYELEKYHESLADFTMVIQLKPDAEAYNRRGNVKRKLNNLHGAFEDYSESLKVQSTNYAAFLNRGQLKMDLKDYESAINDFTVAIQLKPDYSVAYYYRGLAKRKLNDNKGGLEDYSMAIEYKPDYENAYYQRGMIKYESGQEHEGCMDLNEAVKLGSELAYDYLITHCK